MKNSLVCCSILLLVAAACAAEFTVGGQEPESSEQTKVVGQAESSAHAVPFKTFMKDGGWCWFQDPRVIVHNGKLLIGSVKGHGEGEALIGVYDLTADKMLGNVKVNQRFDGDDHNSPVFFPRPDGSVLTVYAKHGRDKYHYSRISDPVDEMKWSEELKHKRSSANPKDNVSYMNLLEMKSEGKLYNFYRGIEFNPTFVTSTDYGKTWSEPTHFFKSEIGGRHRPYPRYAGNGDDTVYVSITDGHPRDFGNSIYYFEFRDGKFYKADGTLIKNLASDGPLLPSEAELVYKGSGSRGEGKGQSAPGAAWTSSIVIDENGHPHIGYTVYLSNSDHRYRIASWDGTRWHDREVAFAGNCLYPEESSYTGLITLDPVDPTVVFISGDVDPATGTDHGGQHEIYRATVGLQDQVATIQWNAVTNDSPVRNIRPVILRNNGNRIVLWNRGEFNSYQDYHLDTVGFVESTASE